ncbi:MAG: hypothetical protein R3F54_06565 [Alphaproteobacteria bacterium]
MEEQASCRDVLVDPPGKTTGIGAGKDRQRDEFLLTPGPLTTSLSVKQAMLRDWGSRDPAFIELNADIRRRLEGIANAGADFYVCPSRAPAPSRSRRRSARSCRETASFWCWSTAPMARMVKIMQRLGRATTALTCPENETHDPGEVQSTLQDDPAITHVAVVHCETTSGVLNPIEPISNKVHAEGRAPL